jgi:hypothetical protein
VLVAKLCYFLQTFANFANILSPVLLGLFKHSLYLVFDHKALIEAHLILNGLMQGKLTILTILTIFRFAFNTQWSNERQLTRITVDTQWSNARQLT